MTILGDRYKINFSIRAPQLKFNSSYDKVWGLYLYFFAAIDSKSREKTLDHFIKNYSSDSKEIESAEVIKTAKVESTKTGSSIRTENTISKTEITSNPIIQNELVSTDYAVEKTASTKKKDVADFSNSIKPSKVIFGNIENQSKTQKMTPVR